MQILALHNIFRRCIRKIIYKTIEFDRTLVFDIETYVCDLERQVNTDNN